MKLLLSTFVSLLALSAAATAADVIVEDVAVAAQYDWSGVYVGVQGGYAWGDATIDDDLLIDDFDVETDGGFIGAHVSALWQMNQFVFGLEGEVNYGELDEERDTELPVGNFLGSEIDWFGSVSGKAGVALDRVLIYGTAGVAFADVETNQRFGALEFSESETSVGWTAGVGVDFAATDRIIVGAQYRYYDFGSEEFEPGAPFTDREQEVDLHTVSLKASYKF